MHAHRARPSRAYGAQYARNTHDDMRCSRPPDRRTPPDAPRERRFFARITPRDDARPHRATARDGGDDDDGGGDGERRAMRRATREARGARDDARWRAGGDGDGDGDVWDGSARASADDDDDAKRRDDGSEREGGGEPADGAREGADDDGGEDDDADAAEAAGGGARRVRNADARERAGAGSDAREGR